MSFFNPFLNHYHEETFNFESVIFPDKMKNMYHLRLNVPLIHFPPYSTIDGNHKIGLKPGSIGYFYHSYRHALEKLNCSFNYIAIILYYSYQFKN